MCRVWMKMEAVEERTCMRKQEKINLVHPLIIAVYYNWMGASIFCCEDTMGGLLWKWTKNSVAKVSSTSPLSSRLILSSAFIITNDTENFPWKSHCEGAIKKKVEFYIKWLVNKSNKVSSSILWRRRQEESKATTTWKTNFIEAHDGIYKVIKVSPNKTLPRLFWPFFTLTNNKIQNLFRCDEIYEYLRKFLVHLANFRGGHWVESFRWKMFYGWKS